MTDKFLFYCRYNSQLGALKREIRTCKSKMGEQQKLLLEYATRLDENDKKSEETTRKFSTLLQVSVSIT